MKSRGLVGRKRIVLLLGMAVSMLGSSPTTAQPSLPAIPLKAPLTISPHAAISNVTLLLENDNANGAVFGGLATNTGGFGVVGLASGTSSANFGVAGATQSAAGTGVYGLALSSSCNPMDFRFRFTCFGVVGQSQAVGITATAGVLGLTAADNSIGAPPSAFGVFGHATDTSGGFTVGTGGQSDSVIGTGVFGIATAAGCPGVDIFGTVTLGQTCFGVAGLATGSNGFGVWGQDLNGVGVVGQGIEGVVATGIDAVVATGSGFGVLAFETGPGGTAVWGQANGSNGVGVLGETLGGGVGGQFFGGSGGIAAAFFGPVQVNGALTETGNLTVNGNFTATGTKAALVDTESYGKRQLYAVESPQNWFEDVGSAKLINGHALITLDPIFAQTVNTKDEYHIFLTPKGDCKGLYVAHQRATSFEVKELQNGKSSIAFDYRIVAKRKGYERVRLPEPAR